MFFRSFFVIYDDNPYEQIQNPLIYAEQTFRKTEIFSLPVAKYTGLNSYTGRVETVFKDNGRYEIYVSNGLIYTERLIDTVCEVKFVNPKDPRPEPGLRQVYIDSMNSGFID